MLKETCVSKLDKKISIYGSISYFEEAKENNQLNLITTTKIKFNVIENTYKEEIVLELTQEFNEDIDTTKNILNNFGILVTSKNKQIGQKRNMPVKIV